MRIKDERKNLWITQPIRWFLPWYTNLLLNLTYFVLTYSRPLWVSRVGNYPPRFGRTEGIENQWLSVVLMWWLKAASPWFNRIEKPKIGGASVTRRSVVPGGARGAIAPPDFGRSDNPISTRRGRLCPLHYYWHHRICRPSWGPYANSIKSFAMDYVPLVFV